MSGGRCVECGQSWDENPARKVECPDCGAAEGSPCKRPSHWDCAPHSARWRAAVDELCQVEGRPCTDDRPDPGQKTLDQSLQAGLRS